VRGRRPRRSHTWLAAALLAGIAIALGILYVAIEREAPIQRGAATMASRAREPAALLTVDSPARADAEPAAPVTGTFTKPTTSSPPPQRPDSPPADTAATAPGFAFQAPRYAMSESKSLISIPIERKDGRGAATVVWWTVEGDAQAYDDYAYLGRRTESFADGETTRYIQIPVVSDHIAEGDEDFFVELASPGAVADADTLTRTEVVIRDDD
jgi:hypothetical protein